VLPPELRDSAIEYRKLKKLINKVVSELNSLGLSPDVLQEVLRQGDSELSTPRTIRINDQEVKVVYELSKVSDHIEPRLRLLVKSDETVHGLSQAAPLSSSSSTLLAVETADADAIPALVESISELHEHQTSSGENLAEHGEQLQEDHTTAAIEEISSPEQLRLALDANETVIPLVSDTAFYQLLTQTLQYLSMRLMAVRVDFESSLRTLSRTIANSARPMSSSSSFRPYSAHSSDAATISVQTPSNALFTATKSDLYAWREVFQLYVEAEIFESHAERTRGEWSIEDSEARLEAFMQRLKDKGLTDGRVFRVKESREAMETFLHLNAFILDLRKFQHATSEATRKILKKHAKRTALPLAPALSSPFLITEVGTVPSVSLMLQSSQSYGSSNAIASERTISLSLLLGQAIGENILPIIPHIDDYACLICTSIAFKPIRLSCGHLFCVRCLVKMQKRGQGHCPMCRAPTVLSADRSNVDWALLNFMKDWFPIESRKKLRQNEKEVAEEEWEELGIEAGSCAVM